MSVYKNIEVSIPKEHVTIEKQPNGKPALIKYVLSAPYNKAKKYPEPKRTTIGHQSLKTPGMMNPTTQYADIFPELWETISGTTVKPKVKGIGIFSYGQAMNSYLGIKDMLDSVYGDKADAIMDYALYCMFHNTDVTQLFESRMKQELLYSRQAHSDSYYSLLFEKGINREEELLLKKKWANQCKDEGVENVWLCIDGSNDDCRSHGVELAEKGHAKSNTNTNIVSFSYAITPDGKPVTFELYNGGLVDAKAMKSIIDFLAECGISIYGVILDRGYCDGNVLEYLTKHNIEYCIMVKGTPEGVDKIVADYGEKIKMNANYLIPQTCLFGVQEAVQLFKGYQKVDYATLFFDYQNGSERITTLLNNLYDTISNAEAKAAKGECPIIEKKYAELITILEFKENKSIRYEVSINKAGLQKAMDEKGLYSIVSSQAKSPAEINALYNSRNASEEQYRSMKTQLGYGVVRVQNTQSVRSKFLIAFLASIMRYEAVCAAKTVNKSTNKMLADISRLEMLNINGVYAYSHTESIVIKDFFSCFNVNVEELMNESVQIENDRINGTTPTLRKRKTGPQKGSHRIKLDETGNPIKIKKGVAIGTKRNNINADGTLRKKPGVKKGTKRGSYTKNGELRKKPGPKIGTHHDAQSKV